jgi:sugar-specific transcriptional regulator TrmB
MYEKLVHIGLTGTEAKIYLMLVDLSKAQAGVLSRRTGIHRRSIYDALDRLIEKGLVSYIMENDKRFYMPTDPQRIQEIIDQQREEILEIMPTLHAKFMEKKDKQQTFFYRGKEGIRSVFEDQIKVGKPVYIIGASDLAEKHLKYYLPHYTEKRKKKKIKLHALYAGEKSKLNIPLAKVRYLPKTFSRLVSTNIWGKKTAIILWLPHDPVAIVVNQPDIAETFKKYFDQLWKIAED